MARAAKGRGVYRIPSRRITIVSDHRARRRFGQNFLHDSRVVSRIVQAVAPSPGDHLVEIGPGRGALTRALLPYCDGRFDLVELDRDLVAILTDEFADLEHVVIHSADALQFDFRSLDRGSKLRVVANLPYNISTPILFHLLAHTGIIQDLHLMLQKEVVERMIAGPGSKAYGRLSVNLAYHCTCEQLFLVPPGAFRPIPKVESAVVRLTPHATPPVDIQDLVLFNRIVTQAFSQRRKTLRNSLRTVLSAESMEAIDIAPIRRPETLTLAEFAALANAASAGKES